METTEKIVEAYARYVEGWATIPNIRCPGQSEIDLLAIDPKTGNKYHIESGVSISGAHSKLTAKPFDPERMKVRVEKPAQRRTLGYFVKHKFSSPGVMKTLRDYGFIKGRYGKIIVTWGWTPEAFHEAQQLGIDLWDFPDLMDKIAKKIEDKRSYFTDDTLRTIHLFVKGTGGRNRNAGAESD